MARTLDDAEIGINSPLLIRSRNPSLLITASRALTLSDTGRDLYSNDAAIYTLTIAANTFLPDSEMSFFVAGTGYIILAPGIGVTINGLNSPIIVLSGTKVDLKFYDTNTLSAIRLSGTKETVRNLFTDNNSNVSTGTTAEVVFSSYLLPAYTLGLNSCLEFDLLVSMSSGASGKTFRIKIGSTIVFSTGALTTNLSGTYRRTIRNRNSLSSQIAAPAVSPSSYANSSVAASTFSIDFSVDRSITITGQANTSTDTITLQGVSIFAYN